MCWRSLYGIPNTPVIVPVVNLPINVDGNTVSIIGDNTVTTPVGSGLEEPGTDPENPGSDPENPGTNPGDPGTPGEQNTPADTSDQSGSDDPTAPGTSIETGDGVTPTAPGNGQAGATVDNGETAQGGLAVTGELAGVVGQQEMGVIAGAREPTLNARGSTRGADMLAHMGANTGSLVWVGGALAMLGLAELGLRRRFGAE